ncbi:MAG TPA: HDIG domain-containing protein [Candidatus Nanoarchaeia archaeon]|nr:HDIG domain-containing protein [Candidatus Nanoarchaeia archaeon]
MNEQQAIELLKKYSSDDGAFKKVLAHVQAVKKAALRIADRIPGTDKEFIATASILHDIGRFQFPPGSKNAIQHGIKGAEILRKEGFPKHALVAERHIGVGISRKDIREQNLPLPDKDFLPISKEEKIIAHADNLIFGDKEGTLQMVIDRFRMELGEEYAERVKRLAGEVEGWQRD